MSLTPHRYIVLALLLSGGLLAGAYVFEHVLGYAPCQMCYWQRYAHMAVIALCVIALLVERFHSANAQPRVWAWLIVIAFLVSAGIAFWHTGVEFKWWEGPKTCLAGDAGVVDAGDLLNSLKENIKPPACSEAPWHLLGLSMAAWNVVASLFGAALGVIGLKGKRHV